MNGFWSHGKFYEFNPDGRLGYRRKEPMDAQLNLEAHIQVEGEVIHINCDAVEGAVHPNYFTVAQFVGGLNLMSAMCGTCGAWLFGAGEWKEC